MLDMRDVERLLISVPVVWHIGASGCADVIVEHPPVGKHINNIHVKDLTKGYAIPWAIPASAWRAVRGDPRRHRDDDLRYAIAG